MLSTPAVARFRAVALFVAPAFIFLGFVYHPYIGNGTDDAAIASAASDDTTRWGLATLPSAWATHSWRSPSSRSEAISMKRAKRGGVRLHFRSQLSVAVCSSH